MRVLLIQPSIPKGLNMVPQCAPPMGLMYLAAYLRMKRPGDEIRILDLQVNGLSASDAVAAAREFNPGVVGITSMSVHSPTTHEIARGIKESLPNAKIIVGGPYVVASPDLAIKDLNIDAGAVGEGETTFAEFVEVVDKGGLLRNVPGLVLRDDKGKMIDSGVRPYIEDLDSLPLPARDLVDMNKFFDFNTLTQNDMRAHNRYTTIFTSRACPYKCIFCHNVFGKKFRARSAANVLAEMEHLYEKYGVREFHINDDCFNLKLDRAAEVMNGVIERGWKIHIAFPNGIRADKLPDDLLDLMRRAGVYKMNFGVEAGSQRIQQLIHKNLDLEALKDAVERADRRGVITHGFFMLGFPGETEEEMLETIEFACSSKLMMAGFFYVNPYPNTELYEVAKATGRLAEFTGSGGCYTSASVNVSAAPNEVLQKMQNMAYRRFYSNPIRMAKIVWRIPRKSDLFRAAKAQLKVKFF